MRIARTAPPTRRLVAEEPLGVGGYDAITSITSTNEAGRVNKVTSNAMSYCKSWEKDVVEIQVHEREIRSGKQTTIISRSYYSPQGLTFDLV